MHIGLANLIDEGTVVHVEESRTFYAAKQAAGGQQGPSNYEELKEARTSLPTRPSESRTVVRIARAGKGQVPVRVTSPSAGGSRATYLDIHGGGFFMDSAARSDARNARLADALRVTVVSVEYRLAPEHPWPAAPDDCETAALWLVEAGRQLFDTERMLIGGASAGATLADDDAASPAGPGSCPSDCRRRLAVRRLRPKRAVAWWPAACRRVVHPGVRRARARSDRS